mgnify:CR=1 FL=1|tara:strand:+ start:729 stop:1685 length:957 start_codon:yes stop_codon:yes gene_type:complete
MKKTHFYLASIIVLILLMLIFINKNQSKSSLRFDKRNFAIEDTVSINQIILQNRNLEKITLTRETDQNQWVLNDSIPANQYLINLLLKTMKEMRVKQPIARAALTNIIKRMAIQHTKVEIFQNDKKMKTIYVGGETQDQLGTFMMIEGAVEPYIMHIPGFNGYLSSRFSCKKELWRSKKVFAHNIKTAKYRFENELNIINVSNNNIQNLTQIYCESYLANNDNFSINDIKKRQPFVTITTITEDNKIEEFYCIRKKPVNKNKYAEHKYDRERFYGVINNTLMLIQYKQLNEFIESEAIVDNFTPWKNKNKIETIFQNP